MGHTREALLDAAREAALTTGWTRARMADVAAAAGLSRQTLYAEFGSKDGLAQALALREADRLVDGAEAARDGHAGSPAEALAASTEWVLRAAGTDPLVKAVLVDDGPDGLLPYLTTRSEALLAAVADRNAAWLAAQWPELPADEVAFVAGTLVRLTVSHIVSPAEPADVTARRLAHLVDRLLPAASHSPSATPGARSCTADKYVVPTTVDATWDVPMSGDARFTWEYDGGRDRLLSLYQKGKDKQWDATSRIDWSLEVDPYDPVGLPDQVSAIYDTPIWNKMSARQRDELRRNQAAWQFSQFLHGEQGAMICSARIVESVPDLDSKFYAATQTMDEARHAETYARFLQEKMGIVFPINDNLSTLLEETLRDSRWDMPYLGMQVLIEGLALAAFGLLRDMTTKPLPKQILAYVMQDEARHVAFGRLALKDAYTQLTTRERDEREEFVVEACYLMRDRIRGREVWETVGLDTAACDAYVDSSEFSRLFRNHLFTRIVPIVKDIGLWGPKVQRAYADMGVLELGDANLDALMKDDEDVAERLDRDRAEAHEVEVRIAEIEQTIAVGAGETPVAVDQRV